jgi:tetratricopeptide (TPR) repeat protein
VSGSSIDPGIFVASVKPLLEARDLQGLLCHLKANWTAQQITNLLSGPDEDARKVAALALSLVGGRCCIPVIAERLKDADSMTNQMAEHALWSIWFRCGTPTANAELARGTHRLSDRDFAGALTHFDRAIEICPDFAEAYNQRAITHYLLEDFERSKRDCEMVTELMPCHFGAWAGLGHCYAHLEDLPEAVRCYEQALEVNPHLEGIRQAVCELRTQLGLGRR